MNALTNTTNTSVAPVGSNPWATAGAGAGSTTFMKFKGASGDYLAGQDEEEVVHGTKLAADIVNSEWAWTFWWEGEVLEKITTKVATNPTAWEREPDHLPKDYDGDMSLEEIREAQADRATNFMDGWGCQAVLGLREIGGEGEEFTFNMNAGVSLRGFRNLLQAYGRTFMFKEGLVPIVELGVDSFKSKVKNVGKRYSPVLKIVDWLSEEDLQNAAGEDPGDYDAPDRDEGVAAKAIEDKSAASEPDAAPRGRRGARGANYDT